RPADLAPVATQQLRSGASIVRLQQQIDHVDVHHGELRVMVQADGALAAVSGTMRASAGRAAVRSTAAAGTEPALAALDGAGPGHPAIARESERGGYQELHVAETAELRVTSARAKRELWFDGGRMTPVWSVEVIADRAIEDRYESAARSYLIADADGSVL